jgi:hypothetical protein
MRCFRAVGVLALFAVTTSPAFALERAQHTVDWYQAHQQERESVLKACQNDHSYDNSADCRNATSAMHGALADSLARPTGPDPEANPAYYAHNPGVLAMTLSQCSHHQAPPAWCQAAQLASTNARR